MTKTKKTNVRFEAETSHMIRLSVQKVALINEINIGRHV